MMIAGDAAHLMPPFAGQGMCAGLRDAMNLAWKLGLVLQGKAAEAVLDSYGPERVPHVRGFIDFSMELGRLICITDPGEAAERDARMLAPRADPLAAAEPPPTPRLGPGLLLDGDPTAGTMSIQAPVTSSAGSGLFDDVVGAGACCSARSRSPWTILATGPGRCRSASSPSGRTRIRRRRRRHRRLYRVAQRAACRCRADPTRLRRLRNRPTRRRRQHAGRRVPHHPRPPDTRAGSDDLARVRVDRDLTSRHATTLRRLRRRRVVSQPGGKVLDRDVVALPLVGRD